MSFTMGNTTRLVVTVAREVSSSRSALLGCAQLSTDRLAAPVAGLIGE
ncbi:hypothetical protein ACT17S_11530 [Glutamicibacter mysorens]